MAKKPRAKKLKPPVKCIFCEKITGPKLGDRLSGEHLFSEWMNKAKLLPKSPEYVEFKQVLHNRSRDVKSKYEKTRQGSVDTKKFKVVCETCNNEWMSRLETAIQPYLTPLIKGLPIHLDEPMRRTLVEWIVLKVMVAEHTEYYAHPADPIFDQSMRSAFMNSRVIPSGGRIWIAFQKGDAWATKWHRRAVGLGVTATLPPPKQDATRPKNVQAVTWGIGNLLIYLNATTDMQVYGFLELGSPNPFSLLWPDPGTVISWPPKFFAGDEYIDSLADTLEDLIRSPQTVWPEETP